VPGSVFKLKLALKAESGGDVLNTTQPGKDHFVVSAMKLTEDFLKPCQNA